MRNPLDVMRIRSASSRNAFVKERSQTHNVFGAGIRINDRTGKPRDHTGWDLAADEGTVVLAVATGKVVGVRWDTENNHSDYGNQIEIEFTHDGHKYRAFYAHLSVIFVSPKEQVHEGQAIGLTGHTGNARSLSRDQWHLHFEIRSTEMLPNDRLRHNSIDPATLLGGSLLSCQPPTVQSKGTATFSTPDPAPSSKPISSPVRTRLP